MAELTVAQVNDILNKRDENEVMQLMSRDDFDQFLKKSGDEVISTLMEGLSFKAWLTNRRLFYIYGNLVKTISAVSQTNCAIIDILRGFTRSKICLESLTLVLDALKIAVERIKNSGANTFFEKCLMFSMIYVRTVLNYRFNIWFKKEINLDINPMYQDLCEAYEATVTFYRSMETLVSNQCEDFTLLNFYFELLDRPLIYFDLNRNVRNQLPYIPIVKCILLKRPNPLTLLDDIDVTEVPSTQKRIIMCSCYGRRLKYSSKSKYGIQLNFKAAKRPCDPLTVRRVRTAPLAVFYYLLAKMDDLWENIPSPYSTMYLFHVFLYLSVCLMMQEEKHWEIGWANYKGLFLAGKIFNIVPAGFVTYQYFQYPVHRKFFEHLSRIITYSKISSCRTLASRLMKQYVQKLNTESKYWLFLCCFDITRNVSIDSWIIVECKDKFLECCNKNDFESYFEGERLKNLVTRFFMYSLTDGRADSIHNEAERIQAAISFLMFILIRDRNNTTKIWEYRDHFKNICDKLENAIEISTVHVEHMKQVVGHMKPPQHPVVVNEEEVQPQTKDEALQNVDKCRCKLALISSNLAWLKEKLINGGPKIC